MNASRTPSETRFKMPKSSDCAAARERTEIRNTRAEAKRLRSDNAVLDAQVQALYKRVRLWSSATALVSGCAAALPLAIVSGGQQTATASTVV